MGRKACSAAQARASQTLRLVCSWPASVRKVSLAMAAPLPKGVAVHSTIPGVERLRLSNSYNKPIKANESAPSNTVAKRSCGGRRNRRSRHRRPATPARVARQNSPIATLDTPLYDKAFPPLRKRSPTDVQQTAPSSGKSSAAKMVLVQLLRGVSRAQQAIRSPSVSYSTATKASPPAAVLEAQETRKHRYTSFFKVPHFSPSVARQRIRPKRLRMSRLNRQFRKALAHAFGLVEKKGCASTPKELNDKSLTVSHERLARTPRMTVPVFKAKPHQQ